MTIDESEIETVIINSDGVTYVYPETCALTDAQKVDIEVSQIKSKKDLPGYLDRCAQLRADNPGWTDETVRAVAKAST